MTERKKDGGPIAWMAGHPVAANLLMAALLIGGIMSALRVRQEVFPEFSLDIIGISVPYPGASPEEVERGIITVIEDAVRGLDGVVILWSVPVRPRATVGQLRRGKVGPRA